MNRQTPNAKTLSRTLTSHTQPRSTPVADLRMRALKGFVLASIMTLAATAVVAPEAARAETVPYDPSTCASDPGETVTIALRRIVLQVPMMELSGIAALPPDMLAAAPIPPDPSQPEGCPDHPMVGSAFYFRYLIDAVPNAELPLNPVPRRVDRLVLIAADPDFWGLQFFWEERFERVCERYELRDLLDNGLERCRVLPDDADIPQDHWPFYIRAPLALYSTPFGNHFTADCLWGSVPGTHRCGVTYKLYDTLNVSYRFQPRRLPIDGLIDFDQELRVWIDSMRVPNFVWADEPDINGDPL